MPTLGGEAIQTLQKCIWAVQKETWSQQEAKCNFKKFSDNRPRHIYEKCSKSVFVYFHNYEIS